MKLAPLFPLLAAAFVAVPRASAQRAPSGAAAPTLIRLENAWASALVRRDGATFERILAPTFVYTENDRLMTRAEVLQGVVAGSDTVTAAHNEDMVVHGYASNVAVVTGWLIVSGHGPAGAFTHRYRFTDTWVRRGGRWQIVAAQDYLAPAGTP